MIAISTWSFHNQFARTREASAPSELPLIELLDFPAMIADRFHIHELEAVSTHFSSTDSSYLREFRTQLQRAHSRVVNIPADIGYRDVPGLSSSDADARDVVVRLYSEWIDHAQAIGAAAVRCDPGTFDPADLSAPIESYRRLLRYGAARNVDVIVENHGAVPCARPEALAQILKDSGAGALPDIGNWPDGETRERGLRDLFPLARHVCHVKFQPARFDLGRYLDLSREFGFNGVYSIEAGGATDPYQEVETILEQLRRLLPQPLPPA